jgi:uncharacterized membrane protein YdfJ with MMPL/SSD domain
MVLLGRANWWLPRWLARILPAAEPAEATPSIRYRSASPERVARLRAGG